MKNENTINPWKGLQPYDDNAFDLQHHPFCGRESAIHEIFCLIEDNISTTLYGKSGIGKTSLLKAGIFPLLRGNQYVPIYIRLNVHMLEKYTYADAIVNEILKKCKKENITISKKEKENTNKDIVSAHQDFLWKFFAETDFQDTNGKVIFPVIILDQFEEIFNSNLKQEAVRVLLHQLRELMNENKLYGTSAPVVNYRLVLCMREDDLFLLEEAVDTYHVENLKLNRYRLKSLTDKEAREIIEIGKDYIEDANKEEIIKIILEKSIYKDSYSISTDMLSLTCSQLFIQTQGEITLAAIKKLDDSMLENFYTESIGKVSPEAREYIEEKLEKDSRRSVVLKEELNRNLTEEEYKILSEGEYKILHSITIDSVKYVELIHDSLSQAIGSLKKKKAELEQIAALKEHKRKQKRYLVILFLIVLPILVGFIIYLAKENKNLSDTRGYGVKQKFLIAFSVDSVVLADDELWRANLRIIGSDGSRDSILKDTIITETFKDSSIAFESERWKSFKVLMSFPSNMMIYKDIKIERPLSYFTDSTELKLRVEYDFNKMKDSLRILSGQVFTNVDGETLCLKDILVVFKNKLARTDSKGKFVLFLNNRLEHDDVISLFSPGFLSIEDSVYEKGKSKKNIEYFLVPSDSSFAFNMRCEKVDSMIKTSNQKGASKLLSSIRKGLKLQGAPFKKENGETDYLIFRIWETGKKSKGTTPLFGLYYSKKEFEKDGKSAYHIFNGRMKKEKDGVSCQFEGYGTDKNGEKQIVKGLIKDKVFIAAGEIEKSDGSIMPFGQNDFYQEYEEFFKLKVNV